MFEIDIQREFASAHRLKGYNGNCSSLHGHNWTVQAFVQAEKLDEIGIAIDFKKLKRVLDKILDALDHKCLNEIPPFDQNNPTSENLAKYIYETLSEQINDTKAKVTKVRVCESPGSGASYFEN